jgi:hypothetical protein
MWCANYQKVRICWSNSRLDPLEVPTTSNQSLARKSLPTPWSTASSIRSTWRFPTPWKCGSIIEHLFCSDIHERYTFCYNLAQAAHFLVHLVTFHGYPRWQRYTQTGMAATSLNEHDTYNSIGRRTITFLFDSLWGDYLSILVRREPDIIHCTNSSTHLRHQAMPLCSRSQVHVIRTSNHQWPEDDGFPGVRSTPYFELKPGNEECLSWDLPSIATYITIWVL